MPGISILGSFRSGEREEGATGVAPPWYASDGFQWMNDDFNLLEWCDATLLAINIDRSNAVLRWQR